LILEVLSEYPVHLFQFSDSNCGSHFSLGFFLTVAFTSATSTFFAVLFERSVRAVILLDSLHQVIISLTLNFQLMLRRLLSIDFDVKLLKVGVSEGLMMCLLDCRELLVKICVIF
jgi:hypothetical protein